MAKGIPLGRQKFHNDVTKHFVGTTGSRRIAKDAWGVNRDMLNDVKTDEVVIVNPTTNRWVPRGVANDLTNRVMASDHQTPYETNENTMKPQRGKSHVQMDSTAIEKVEYDPTKKIARVWYKGQNNHYNYKVTPDEMQEFLKASSPGRHIATVWNDNPHFYTADRT